jgi:preprotein translocase subunit SecD
MHSYPAWRIWLVAIVMLLALVLALPNVFGEAPSLQLSRDDRAPFNEQTQAGVTALLSAKGIPVDAAHIEGDRLVLRFEDVEQQLAAREAIQQGAPGEYLAALSQSSRMPGWMRAIGLKPMSLGLDLRGGVYFLYEVDVAGAVKQLLATMERDYRTLLRNERIPFTGIEAVGNDAVRVTLRSGADVERAEALLRKQDSNLTIDSDRSGTISASSNSSSVPSPP